MSVTPLDQIRIMENNLAEKRNKLKAIQANIDHQASIIGPLLAVRKRIHEHKVFIGQFAGFLKADDKDTREMIRIIRKINAGTASEREALKVIGKLSNQTLSDQDKQDIFGDKNRDPKWIDKIDKFADKGALLKELTLELVAFKREEELYMAGTSELGRDVERINIELEKAKTERQRMVLEITKLERELHDAIKNLPPALSAEHQLNIIDRKAQERIKELEKIKERILALENDKKNEKGLWIINPDMAEQDLARLRDKLKDEERSAMRHFAFLDSMKRDLVKKRAMDSSDKPAKGKKKI